MSGGSDKTIRIWDVEEGICVGILSGHTDHVLSLCVSADNRWLISSSYDHTVRIWELDWDFQPLLHERPS